MRIILASFALLMSTNVFANELSFGVSNEAFQADVASMSDNVADRDFDRGERLLAAGIYSARANDGVLCDQSIRPVFSGDLFIGYDVTTLGTCQRLTARFTCRRNYCETNVNNGLYISIVSTTSYVFTNQNEGRSSIFEL